MTRLLRVLLVLPIIALLGFSGCSRGNAPKKNKDQPATMDMDNVPPVKP